MPRRKEPSAVAAPAPSPGRVACPFTVLVDTNENQPNHDAYRFLDIESNADTGHRPFAVTVEPRFLENLGDYSLYAHSLGPFEQPRVMIERKSKADLFASVAKRENMENRLARLSDECEFAAVVVEAEWSEIFGDPPRHSNYSPTSLHRTVQSWQQRFNRVHWAFYPGREAAEAATFWYLYRFHENIKDNKLERDRKLAQHAAYLEGARACRKKVPITECPFPKEHRVGGLREWWVRGWLDYEALAMNKARTPSEYLALDDRLLK